MGKKKSKGFSKKDGAVALASGALLAALVTAAVAQHHRSLVEGCRRAYVANLGPLLNIAPPEVQNEINKQISRECVRIVDQN